MSAIVLLFLLGIVLLGFEVITPGGILGVLGGLAMLGGSAVAFNTFGGLGGGLNQRQANRARATNRMVRPALSCSA